LKTVVTFLTCINILSFVCFLISFWSQVISILGDVCDMADCERTVKEVIDCYGQLDVLVSWFGCWEFESCTLAGILRTRHCMWTSSSD
jgi:hypothetical protein